MQNINDDLKNDILKYHVAYKEQIKECLLEQNELREVGTPLYHPFIEKLINKKSVGGLFLCGFDISIFLTIVSSPLWLFFAAFIVGGYSKAKAFVELHEENKAGVKELESIYEEEIDRLRELKEELFALIQKNDELTMTDREEYSQLVEEYYQVVLEGMPTKCEEETKKNKMSNKCVKKAR